MNEADYIAASELARARAILHLMREVCLENVESVLGDGTHDAREYRRDWQRALVYVSETVDRLQTAVEKRMRP